MSRRRAKALIAEGAVFLEGRRCRVSSRVPPVGAAVVVHLEGGATPQDAAGFSVLEETEDYLVVNKGPGIHVNKTQTSAQWALEELLPAKSAHIVHRLDKDTSGVMIVAKTKQRAEALSVAFRDRQVSKVYAALAVGSALPDAGSVSAPIGRDPRRTAGSARSRSR